MCKMRKHVNNKVHNVWWSLSHTFYFIWKVEFGQAVCNSQHSSRHVVIGYKFQFDITILFVNEGTRMHLTNKENKNDAHSWLVFISSQSRQRSSHLYLQDNVGAFNKCRFKKCQTHYCVLSEKNNFITLNYFQQL